MSPSRDWGGRGTAFLVHLLVIRRSYSMSSSLGEGDDCCSSLRFRVDREGIPAEEERKGRTEHRSLKSKKWEYRKFLSPVFPIGPSEGSEILATAQHHCCQLAR